MKLPISIVFYSLASIHSLTCEISIMVNIAANQSSSSGLILLAVEGIIPNWITSESFYPDTRC